MLRTRLWMGAVLIALALGVLLLDRHFEPYYPFLLVLVLLLGLAACYELLHLLGPARGLPGWLCYAGVSLVIVSNWGAVLSHSAEAGPAQPWPWVAATFAFVVLAAFLVEMSRFVEPGDSVVRIALVVWIVAYLGLLACFFVQLRWLGYPMNAERGVLALALAIFVPKMGDTGAYFTGRLLGRHKMSPVLSPKKTWEGAAGGMVTAILTALAINAFGPVLSPLGAILFGLTVGIVGLLGDLAESLIKRDCEKKDASQIMPGFGGVLDVVDAILFAAPVAYVFLASGGV